MMINNSQFWTGEDGQILSIKPLNENVLSLTLAFWPRNPEEFDFLKANCKSLHFSERSTLARIGIEMRLDAPPKVDGRRLVATAKAFLFDGSFPNAPYWKKLLRLGIPVGRLFYAPDSAKLSTEEIWDAINQNTLKLPETISIDRNGNVFLTPHHVRYTLNPRMQRPDFERLINGDASRNYLDKVQVRQSVSPLTIPPRSGVLTACSIYLKEHYIFLNRGIGNFGIHTSAVLLDPIKTSGTNIMLEIYNPGNEPIVNPLVSVEVFRAPAVNQSAVKKRAQKRTHLLEDAKIYFNSLDHSSAPQPHNKRKVSSQARIQVKTKQLQLQPNPSLAFRFQDNPKGKMPQLEENAYPNLVEALDNAPKNADTLITDDFTNLSEYLELLARIPELKLKRIIFRTPSRTHGFFLSNNAQARLDVYNDIGLDTYWYANGDIYQYAYKNGHGFFVREDLAKKWKESTIFAFYGSAEGLSEQETLNISSLIEKLTGFFGNNVGVLTGGGGGVMRLATEQAREKGAITGACYLELEAQPPELGVDFFNTFQETSRHNRQKWFQAADFCIFNVGGVGTLEEAGIELCNLKLGVRPRTPYVFYNTSYWEDLKKQIDIMISSKRAPAWMKDYLLFSNDPDEIVAFYRKTLQLI